MDAHPGAGHEGRQGPARAPRVLLELQPRPTQRESGDRPRGGALLQLRGPSDVELLAEQRVCLAEDISPLRVPNQSEVQVALSNAGNIGAAWAVVEADLPPWLAVRPLSGRLEADQAQVITLSVDRADLWAGDYETQMQVVVGETALSLDVDLDVDSETLLTVTADDLAKGE